MYISTVWVFLKSLSNNILFCKEGLYHSWKNFERGVNPSPQWGREGLSLRASEATRGSARLHLSTSSSFLLSKLSSCRGLRTRHGHLRQASIVLSAKRETSSLALSPRFPKTLIGPAQGKVPNHTARPQSGSENSSSKVRGYHSPEGKRWVTNHNCPSHNRHLHWLSLLKLFIEFIRHFASLIRNVSCAATPFHGRLFSSNCMWPWNNSLNSPHLRVLTMK